MIQHFFSIGADPEIFLQDYKNNYISAVGLLGRTKTNPIFLDKLGNALLEDNVSIEFNTAVANDCYTFTKHIHKNLEAIKTLLPNYKISEESAVSFPEEQLKTPQANTFGCSPDYNAWSGKKNPPPRAKDPNLRSAGGHIHIGHDLAVKYPRLVIQTCDLFLGIPSLFKDSDIKRRELYGKAGAYRKKSFGVEYRSLSNFWIFSDKEIEWVYTQITKLMNFLSNGYEIKSIDKERIQKAINNSDLYEATYLLKKYQNYV